MELAEAGRLERAHVHAIYAQIAPSFDDARYGAWPRVRHFLQGQPPGSIIIDVGCGNGKYLAVNGQAFTLGCDYCLPLVQASRAKGHEVMVSDNLRLPLRDGCADAVISIAVLHHFCTKSRRVRALREMSRALRPGGRIMVYVWAMEQTRRRFNKQDIFIPWRPSARPGASADDAQGGRRAAPRHGSLTTPSPRLCAGRAMRDGDGSRRSSEDLSDVRFYKSARRFSENDVGRRDAEESSYCENGGVNMRRYICNKIASSNGDFTSGGSAPTPHQGREPVKRASLVNGSPELGNRCRTSCCGSRGSGSSVGDLGVKRASGGDLRVGNRSDSCCVDDRSSSSRLYTALEKTFASLFFSRSLDEPLCRSPNRRPGSSESTSHPSVERSNPFHGDKSSQLKSRHRSLEHNSCGGFFQPNHLPGTRNSSKEGPNDPHQDATSEQLRMTESSDEEDDVFVRVRGMDASVGDRAGFFAARRASGPHEEVSRFVEVLAGTSRSKVCLPDLVEAPRRSCARAERGVKRIGKKPSESQSAGRRFSLKEGDGYATHDFELFNGTSGSCEWGRPESPDITENGEHLTNGTKEEFGNDDADCDGEGDGDGGAAETGETPEEPRWLRYYHVFREGELAQMIERHVAGMRVVCTYYDHANWCVIAQKEGGGDTCVEPDTTPSAHSDARPNGAPNAHSNTYPSPSTPPDLHFSAHSNTDFPTHCYAHSHPNTA